MIRQRCTWFCSFLVGLLVTSAVTQADAATITTGGAFPASAEIIAATPSEGSFGDDANTSLAQSFQTDTPFSLRTIFLEYENDANDVGPHTVTMTIFTVADVNATTHDEPPLVGDVLLSESVTFPASSPNPGSDTIARIALDSPLAIAASAGTEGYALRFSDTTNPGWEWLRTTSSLGSVYAGGKAYEDGAEKSSGDRDFVLALSSVPEPAGFVLAVMAAIPAVFRRKR